MKLRQRGFGSNVSTCDGPPFMNKNTQCFAFAGKCAPFSVNGPAIKSASASPANSPVARRINFSAREVTWRKVVEEP